MYLPITQIAQVAQLYVISFKYIAKNVHHFRASCYLLRILMVLKMWKHNYEHLENGTPCFISCTVHIWCHTMFCAPHFNASREIQRMSVAKHIPFSFACMNSMQSFMFSMVKAKPNANLCNQILRRRITIIMLHIFLSLTPFFVIHSRFLLYLYSLCRKSTSLWGMYMCMKTQLYSYVIYIIFT